MKITAKLDEIYKIAELLPRQGIVILQGNLASGKTTLVKEIARLHGLTQEITSPTFSVMQSYEDRIFHYDIYQNGIDALLTNGLFENLLQDGLHLVEWGDERLENLLKKYELKYIKVIIKTIENTREYEVVCA
ncbi:tRNA (adenosine(37)-N6)-threonylcarbamoyltransferase complex ATPase subunit type 1 TsaE [Campylobacter suis]|uniref:tRNA threonylcarbamoyladenosine biosynthesis protein TsaE n=1 Tax=Campylobacter suis TaxID=2790657 RepID=A0ABM8Q2X2_9BACT|nr:tRNA (adenosine(37)-N6)-threonylcarbamoyltransferase complex ATPase subunit type 1 TsaE [Campylobacter suis]CAD7287142.1 tRNA threonylcarbamoyladenosine biosynthesis protein TsaE [Campylobacter suis]